MLAGDPYIADDPELASESRRAMRLTAAFNAIGPHVQLLTPTHPTASDLRRAKWEAARPTVVGDVWLGGGVIVLGA